MLVFYWFLAIDSRGASTSTMRPAICKREGVSPMNPWMIRARWWLAALPPAVLVLWCAAGAQAPAPALAPGSLPHYRASIQARPVAGIRDNLSGLAFSSVTGTLFAVVNKPPAVAELTTDGRLLRLMPLCGDAKDTEGIAHIRDDWFAVADEGSNRVHWLHIGPDTQALSLRDTPQLALGDVTIRNFAVEGLGWDAERRQLLAVMEKWPLRVLAIDLPGGVPQGVGPVQAAQHEWRSAEATGLPSTDLSAIEPEPRTGHLLLLGEEASIIYEYTRSGELISMLPLWAGQNGLTSRVPQPEGMALGDDGALYIVSEPNLFYRFDRK